MEKTGWKHINYTEIIIRLNMKDRILTEEEYRTAIIRFLEICDAEPGTPEHQEVIELTQRMQEYENLSCYERRHLN